MTRFGQKANKLSLISKILSLGVDSKSGTALARPLAESPKDVAICEAASSLSRFLLVTTKGEKLPAPTAEVTAETLAEAMKKFKESV